jgi:hypothetical protein
MRRSSRRSFLKTASASAACAAVWNGAPWLMANAMDLALGLQLYSVRDLLPKDYEGTLRQLGVMGYREVEAAGFFDRSPSQVKQSMDHAGLRCVSAHYPMKDLQPKLAEIIQFGKDLGLNYVVCASPMLKDPSRMKDAGSRATREAMTLDDWRWNAEQFNRIGERVNAAGIRFGYHNHMTEFRGLHAHVHDVTGNSHRRPTHAISRRSSFVYLRVLCGSSIFTSSTKRTGSYTKDVIRSVLGQRFLVQSALNRQIQAHHQHCRGGNHQQSFLKSKWIPASDHADDA